MSAEPALPQDMDAEKGVLGCLLLDPETTLADIGASIKPAFFHSPAHRTLWELIVELHEKGQPVDPVNVQRTLIERKWLDHVGGPAVVLELFSFVPTAAHAEFYARLVIEAHRLRELIRIATAAIQSAYAKPETPEALIDKTCSDLMGISRIAGIDSRRMTADQMAESWLDIQDADEADASPHVAVPMGIECFDREPDGIGGIKADYLVVAAETSGGKTVFCIQGAIAMALAGRRVVVFSYEVSALQIFNRAVAHYGCIPNSELKKRPRERTAEMNQLIAATVASLGALKSNLIVYDDPDLTISMVRRLARKEALSASLGMVVIDYLQLVSTSDLNEEKREREVAVITGEMKKLCRELNCAVWSPSQLNERGQLRESRAIGHAADVILTVVEGQGIRVDKNRNGSRDFIMPLILDGPTQTFRQRCEPCGGRGRLTVGGGGVQCHHCAGSGFHRPAGVGNAF